ncbi:hypothetical protein LV457_07410 [Mycobacterium sp. MYCO198283]|uniref:hypothetical protein n=1 Tax=Mycobacterium sp. MYCO198283 TaxID=2883505 RepID=UPI001E4AE340|nr:hypothetical protein [Mycobacterium sp. MYCO198283]MCG5432118.1 hypothetical protein [Mycobacterium sp. MYCO198283]
MADFYMMLTDEQMRLLDEVLKRRNTELRGMLVRRDAPSRADADEIIRSLSDELVDNLDDEWEPTGYGVEVSRLLNSVNKVRLRFWPDGDTGYYG